MHRLVVINLEPLLVVGQYGEAIFELLEFPLFARVGRSLSHFAAFDRFCAILCVRKNEMPVCRRITDPLDDWSQITHMGMTRSNNEPALSYYFVGLT